MARKALREALKAKGYSIHAHYIDVGAGDMFRHKLIIGGINWMLSRPPPGLDAMMQRYIPGVKRVDVGTYKWQSRSSSRIVK